MDSQALQKKLVQILLQKWGFESIDYTSLRQLSLKLRPEFKISENTLARMAGLRSDGRTHYQYTLDVVAKAAGFLSFKKYEQIILTGRDLQINFSTQPHANFFASYAKIAAKENEVRYIKHLVSYIEKNGISVNEQFLLGEQILQGIRQNKQPQKIIDCLVSNPTLVDIYLKWWVDVDYLDKYYGKAMQGLSKKKDLPTTDFFFANTIAFDYEWENKLKKQSLRRASKLSEVNLTEIIKLKDQHVIFPAARWIKVALVYCYQTGNHDKWNNLLDFSLTILKTLEADEAIILISQLSEIGIYLPTVFRVELEQDFIKIKDEIKFEWDSLVNAGVNLQKLNKQTNLITSAQMLQIIELHQSQVFCSKNRLIKKIKDLKK
jgi:hypothetical protein